MTNDTYVRAVAFASKTALARLLVFLQEKGVLTGGEIELLLSETEEQLRAHGTETAEHAVGIVKNMRDSLKRG